MRGTLRTSVHVGLALLGGLIGGPTASAQVPLPARQDRLEQWLDAVREHEPAIDAALETVASWSISNVRAVWTDIDRLITAMRARNKFTFSVGRFGPPTTIENNTGGVRPVLVCAAAGRIMDSGCIKGLPAALAGPNLIELSRLVEASRAKGDGDNYILRRGALLHADVAMLTPAQLEPVANVTSLRQRYRVHIVDGQQQTFGQVPVHWQVARALLDQVQPANAKRPAPGTDHMVRSWYRATATWMQWHSDYEAEHLAHAREILSSDPDILFLSACIHEAYAGNRIQNAMHAMVLPPGLRTGLGSPADELRTAERFLRRALDARPGFVDAHLHLGRVLFLLGRPADAIGHLVKAVAGTDNGEKLYYGHLFLGAAYAAVRRDGEARTAYQKAASLFPRAQAPHVGLSQLARRRGEREQALRAIDVVFTLGASATEDDDPWLWYYAYHARGADDLLLEVQRPFRQSDSQ